MGGSHVDLEILNLDWLAKIVGAHLNLESLVNQIKVFLKSKIPAKKVTLYLWDEHKKRFYVATEQSRARAYISSPTTHRSLFKTLETNEPAFPERAILIPLATKDKPIGVVECSNLTFAVKPLQYKEEILLLTKIVKIVLANASFFIEYENLNKDIFRFNVLSRALNPTIDEPVAARILADGISGITKFDMFSLLILGKANHRLYLKSKEALAPGSVNKVRKNIRELIFNLTHMPLEQESLQEYIDMPKGTAKKAEIVSYINAPLITKDKIIGIVFLGSFKKSGFTPRDHQNLSILATHAASALENIILYRDLQRTYLSIVKALTQAIEAKDPYTRGHSVLVAKYAVAIAQKMGLSASMIESIQIAGLLHDLGKIGVPEEILLKNDKLTSGEYEVVKAHSEIAIKILGAVEFPHFLQEEKPQDVAPELTLRLFEPADLSADIKLMILHHHEKFIGGGYPKGIKKEEIPLGARILSVADTFEALTADRPYRRAFPLEKAKKILNEISGSQLDPVIVHDFMGLLNNKWFNTIKAEAKK